ncbi:ORC1/CDC6 [Naegleria gruberi]|uniref:Origin recognition complex subunit 1 n=1 Tax=Naegleria gruberi TaxID=5762 RepID=D2VL70_NAEGR|nr:ORC1/CDC6 [Naegleria gruberi]EFC42491.1 ORC1/CDC6 [Naegleria gruberi]|eukprot:XP_002675235.1 ORC1/CDC6 [Naegleria gruberi]
MHQLLLLLLVLRHPSWHYHDLHHPKIIRSTLSSSSTTSTISSLPCREKEIEQIKTSLSNCIQLSCPKTMYIAGEPGTGKTACIKQVLNDLENEYNNTSSNNSNNNNNNSKSNSNNNNIHKFKYIFINAMKLNQPFKAFEIIYDQVIKNSNNKLKIKPKKAQYKPRIENYFKNSKTFNKRKYLIIIIDEMDFFVTKTSNNTKNIHLLYDLVDITRDSNSKLCIIGISNTVSLLDQLNSKIKSRFDEMITFFPYENDQIRTIIESKILTNYDNYFEKGAIKMIGSLIARKAGDIRQAIDIIKRCIEIYSIKGNLQEKKIDSLFVKSIATDFTDRYPISQLSIYHKIFLYCTILEYEMKLKNLKENQNLNNYESNPNNLLFERIVMRFQNLLAMFENSMNINSITTTTTTFNNSNNNNLNNNNNSTSNNNSNNSMNNNNLNNSNNIKYSFINPSLDQLQLIMFTLCELGIISIDNDKRERLPIIHFETEYQLLLFNLEQDDEMKPIMKLNK